MNSEGKLVHETTETVTTRDNHTGAIVDEHVNKTFTEEPLMNSSCPVPPPMPPTDFWMQGAQNDYGRYFDDSHLEMRSSSSIPLPPPMPQRDFWMGGSQMDYGRYFSDEYLMMPTTSSRTIETPIVQVIEMPTVVHESIRREEVEEIQPVIQIEREKTEIRQITQPILDKEIRAIQIEERILPVEVLPTVMPQAVVVRESLDESTRTYENTVRQVVEKAPIIKEVENWRIIEEVQPIIYREVIIPHVIRTSRPYREVIVEQPVFSEVSLQRRELHTWERASLSTFMSQYTVPRYELNTPQHIVAKDVTQTLNLPLNGQLPAVAPVLKKREIITDEIATTTTTTVAATSDLPLNGSRTVGQSVLSAPVVLDKKHVETRGLAGEKVVRDTVTTTTTVRPAVAI